MLRRLLLRLGRIMALMGRGTPMLGGDAGGETAAMVVTVTATATPLAVEGCARRRWGLRGISAWQDRLFEVRRKKDRLGGGGPHAPGAASDGAN